MKKRWNYCTVLLLSGVLNWRHILVSLVENHDPLGFLLINITSFGLFFIFFCFVYLFTYLLIYFWLCWVFLAACRLSLVAASGGYSSLLCAGFSLQCLLLLQSMGSRCVGFSSCGMWAQQSWHTGLVAPWHVGSSQTRAQTRVPWIGRQILNHCATREVPFCAFF